LGGRSFTDELEETMTATTLTHIAAREHINELRREAERYRCAAEVTTPRGPRRSIARLLAGRVGRPATA
jgi:hypothetical protein